MNKSLKTNIKSNQALYFVLLAGLFIRCLYLYFYSNSPDWDMLTVDNNYHHNWALSILSGNIFGDTTYFRAPFYIYYLTAIYKVFGVSLWAVRICGIIIGLLSILLTYKTAEKIFNKTVGTITAFIHALYPVIFYFESELLLDSLFMLLFQASVYWFILWWERQTNHTLFISGLFLSLSTITRPTPLILIPIFLIAIFLISKTFKLKIIRSLLFILGSFVFVTPIFARNIIVADDPVLVASQGGINFYIGNNESADGISATMPEPLGFNWRISDINHIAENELKNSKLKPGELSTFWFIKGLDWINSNPVDFIKLYFKKLYYNFTNIEVSNNRQLKSYFDKIPVLKYSLFSFGSIFGLAVIGLFLAGRKKRKLLFLLSIVLSYILVSSLFFFNSRFRLPMLPYYFIPAGFCLYFIVNQFKSNLKGASLNLSLVILCGLFSFYPIVPIPPGAPSQADLSSGLYNTANNNYPDALSSFRKAYAIDPQFPETNLNLGVTFLRLGVEDSALFYLYEEIEHHPYRNKAYTNLSSINLLNENYYFANFYLDKSLLLKPYDITAIRLKQRLLFAENTDPSTIDKLLKPLLERFDNDIYLLYEAALYYQNLGENTLAIKYLTAATETEPPSIETDDEAFQFKSKHTPAIWNREKSKCYNQMSYISAMRAKYKPAIEYALRAIELDPNNVDAYSNLISGYLSVNNVVEAQHYLIISLEKFPANKNLQRIKEFLQ